MNIIATIHEEIDELSERRAELWYRLSNGRDPELVQQIKELDEQLEALWNEHRAVRSLHPLRRARADREAGPGGRAPGARRLTTTSGGGAAGLPAPPPYNRAMPFKRREEPTTIEDEREALRAQHAALEDLKRQLAERVEAVRERELELQHVARRGRAAPGRDAVPRAGTAPPARPSPATEADTGRGRARGRSAANDALARARAGDRAAGGPARASGERELELRARAARRATRLHLRPRADGAERPPCPTRRARPRPEPDAERLAQIEARLGGAARRREALPPHARRARRPQRGGRGPRAARRPEGARARRARGREGRVGAPELTEMEARLRRLEQQQGPARADARASRGGLRKLQQGTRPQPRRG